MFEGKPSNPERNWNWKPNSPERKRKNALVIVEVLINAEDLVGVEKKALHSATELLL